MPEEDIMDTPESYQASLGLAVNVALVAMPAYGCDGWAFPADYLRRISGVTRNLYQTRIDFFRDRLRAGRLVHFAATESGGTPSCFFASIKPFDPAVMRTSMPDGERIAVLCQSGLDIRAFVPLDLTYGEMPDLDHLRQVWAALGHGKPVTAFAPLLSPPPIRWRTRRLLPYLRPAA